MNISKGKKERKKEIYYFHIVNWNDFKTKCVLKQIIKKKNQEIYKLFIGKLDS